MMELKSSHQDLRFAPAPFFWNTIALPEVPVAVMMIGAIMLSVYPAAKLNVTPPVPKLWAFKLVTAAEINP